jgi:hypothetical protein
MLGGVYPSSQVKENLQDCQPRSESQKGLWEGWNEDIGETQGHLIRVWFLANKDAGRHHQFIAVMTAPH